MAKILVTGGLGFIGSHLAEALARAGHDVVVLDNLDPFYDEALKMRNRAAVEAAAAEGRGRVAFENADVSDRDKIREIFARERFEYVYHEAAQAGVRPSLRDPWKYMRVNADGTLALLEAARAYPVRRFVNASTSSVFGKARYLPYDEQHPTEPVSPYGATKLLAEHLVRIYHEAHAVPGVSLRYFTVYGPRMRPSMAISNFTALAHQQKKPVIYGDGTARRDFTHIDDVVALNLRLMEASAADGHALNIGSGGVITVIDLARHVYALLDAPFEPLHLPKQPGDADVTHADASLARKLLGVAPEVPIRDGVARFVEWYRATAWYRAIAEAAAAKSAEPGA